MEEVLNEKQSFSTRALVLCFAFFSILFALAAYFYLERSLTMDAAYFIYNMIQDGSYFHAHGRYLMVIHQALPLAVFKLGMSLQSILISFSLSYILVHIVIFLALWLVLRDRVLAVATALYFAVGVRQVFYYVVSQPLLGISLVLLVYAVFRNRERINFLTCIGSAICFFVLIKYLHIILVVPIAFLLGFDFLSQNRWKDKYAYLMSLATLCLVAYSLFSIAPSSYQGKSIFGSGEGLLDLPTHEQTMRFAKIFFAANYTKIILFTVVLGYYLASSWKQRNRTTLLKALWISAWFLGFSFVLLVRFYGTGSVEYLEHLSAPLIMIAVLPFACDLLPKIGGRVRVPLLGVILLWGVISIFATHRLYSKRLEWIDATITYVERYPESKFILYWDRRQRPPMITWALSLESLIYSSVMREKPCTLLMTWDDEVLERLTQNDDLFHGAGFKNVSIPQDDLNAAYFEIGKSKYRMMTDEDHDNIAALTIQVGYPLTL